MRGRCGGDPQRLSAPRAAEKGAEGGWEEEEEKEEEEEEESDSINDLKRGGGKENKGGRENEGEFKPQPSTYHRD